MYVRDNWALKIMKLILLLFWISGVFTGAAYSALKIPDPEPTPLILQSFIKMKNHSLFLGMLAYTVHEAIYKTKRPCLTTLPTTKNGVENTMHSRVFLMSFKVFKNVVKLGLEFLIYPLSQH